MKILVATSLTQGARESDYNYCTDGELLWIAEPCFTDKNRLPNACGCGWGFAGLSSRRATSTAIVEDLDMSLDEYEAAIRSSLADQGWPPEWARDIAVDQAGLAMAWDVGCVIERDLDVFSVRRRP